MTLAHGGKLKYRGIKLLNFNPGKCRYRGKVPWYFHNIRPWGLYYTTFYGPNLWIYVIGKSVCPWKAFPA
jgi:hypothetical protein